MKKGRKKNTKIVCNSWRKVVLLRDISAASYETTVYDLLDI